MGELARSPVLDFTLSLISYCPVCVRIRSPVSKTVTLGPIDFAAGPEQRHSGEWKYGDIVKNPLGFNLNLGKNRW